MNSLLTNIGARRRPQARCHGKARCHGQARCRSQAGRWLRNRRGASAVEAAIVLPVFLWILLAMLDLGIAVLRHNALSDAARRVGRAAALHGSLAPERAGGSWGPATVQTTVASEAPLVAGLQHKLPTMPAEDVSVEVRWLDGENRPCDRVQVQFRYTHEPMVPGVLPWGAFDLQAATTTTIVN